MLCRLFGCNKPKGEIEVVVEPKEDKIDNLPYKIAEGELGIKEAAGAANNPAVQKYYKRTVGYTMNDSVAWCGFFVGYCMLEGGVQLTDWMRKNCGGARNWLKFGKKVSTPREGDVVVFWRVAKSDWRGHVGFYAGETATHIQVLGGNQDNSVSIKSYPKSRLLGYRRIAA